MAKDVERIIMRFPVRPYGPVGSILLRLGIALLCVLAVSLAVYFDGAGYRDNNGHVDSYLDALYYATVTLSTTGYGDITPVTHGARLVNVLVVTPLRLVFLIVLVGTTVEVLTRRTTAAIRESVWRRRMHDHVIIVGFGVKGASAMRALIDQGRDVDQIVVVDRSSENVSNAIRLGAVGVQGDAARESVLEQAGIANAETVIVSVDRDDTAVLVTLTSRRLAPRSTIVASVREAQNIDVLRQSGANVVIPTAESAGRMLGVSTYAPVAGELLEDLLEPGAGLELKERPVNETEVGGTMQELILGGEIAIAVVRGGKVYRFDQEEVGALQAGDKVVVIRDCD